ncbi:MULTISPECIES: single-stranded DNA-binding protein [unclassified Roseofilum]|uniref:single-stranded DNA-binding protein n=1 Tax=unclassified Roseofilum TaxID=2620099 RepID=UPI001B2BD761|nr:MULTISPECIES: single-stranded DNA-binding protein [unclassified Roseofilum]MBP0011055.1 single-stranded DNA-binding protein [Roseofilum sp. Belize Diploria]MBP0035457.1 single-stranded DNA-binding protein [Roseofilum sp. Belize BBD 4]
MNSCILMAQIVQDPQLRYTPDETAVTEMLVQFAATKAEDPPHTLKVVGWGNLATEIAQGYHQGDRVILQGSLRMNTFDRPEGFKEKRAELIVSRIHNVHGEPVATQPLATVGATASVQDNVIPMSTPAPAPPRPQPTPAPVAPPPANIQPLEEDEIPF